ncbi:MAG TPA: methyltransferase domain-containing protein [Patescibacteria group bacterium]|nr:methyltransferase domain-containing protein [Patescibacteria group bacterium]
MVTYDEKKLLELTLAEYEGIGTWYEYLVKYRIFRKLKNINSVLLAGLPEEYGLASDILLFAIHGIKVTVIDDRKEKIDEFMNLAEKFGMKENITVKLLKDFKKLPFKENSFDLVTNTEAIQRIPDCKNFIREMERVSGKHVIIFSPNGYYYSHYLITKIKTFRMKEFVSACSLKIAGKNYLDRPPWPAGVAVSSNISFTQGSKAKERLELQKQGKKDSFFISTTKKIFTFFTPALALSEIFYPSPLKEFLSHMFFIHMIK